MTRRAAHVRAIRRSSLALVGLVFVSVYLFPIYWMVTGSFKSQPDLFVNPPQLVPLHPQITSWREKIFHDPLLLRYVGNSFIVAGGTMLLAVALAAPAAYALAKLPMRGKSIIMLFCLSSLMLPAIMLATPLFVIFSHLGLRDNLLGLVVADTTLALPYAIVLLRPTFAAIPKELAEAAAIDGSSTFGAFWRIVLPLARPGLATVAVLSFLWGWGDFVFALTLTSSESQRVVTTGLAAFVSGFFNDWSGAMAFCTMATLPPLILFLVAQRQIVAGLTAGSLRG